MQSCRPTRTTQIATLACELRDQALACELRDPLLNPAVIFRIKPTTVNIGGVELEGPLRVAPSNGTPIWLLFDPTGERDDPLLFGEMLVLHRQCLEEGRLFATKEARDKYQDALVKLANGEAK